MKPLNFLSVVVAVASGLATLGLLFVSGFEWVLVMLLGWVTTLAAVALLVGIFNLLAVHFRKAGQFNLNAAYSIVFLVVFFGLIFIRLLAALVPLALSPDDALGPQFAAFGVSAVDWAFTYVQTPVEATLTALLAIILVLAGARLIRTRRSWSAVLFVVVAVVLIIGLAPIGGLGVLGSLRTSINDLFALGAARGILLAIALGVIAAGVRVITGVDQPYGE